MRETFGKRINRFVLSVDIVDEDIFKKAWELIQQYISTQIELSYWALLTESQVNNKGGLWAKECIGGNNPSFSLYDGDKITGLAAYAFEFKKPLWIVSCDKEPIDQSTTLHDEWSNSDNLPPSDRSKSDNICTIILIPLQHREKTIGVLDLQSSQCKEITKKMCEELKLLADTISKLLMLSESNQDQHKYTLEAIEMHKNALNEESWPLLTKPKIFVASSGRADEMVMGTIQSVLNDFNDQLEVSYWKNSSKSGNINSEILNQIKESQFGICYFSEPSEGASEFPFQDNINVTFEAGILQSQTNPALTALPAGWIPVREAHPYAPPIPFDFAQDRILLIERMQGEKKIPNVDKLRADLKSRIESLLEY